MSAQYVCDNCGRTLLLPSMTNSGNSNTDGYKTFDPLTNRWLDLCNDCRIERMKMLNEKDYIPVPQV